MKYGKKGVSLIMVLLFMMVATIAATATFKWLSSENRSSASRMSVSEAREAASAGIEAARAWMNYKANDVGAAVKQLLDAQQTNANATLKLNNVLQEVQNDRLQSNVYLVSVNQENTTYKMKVLSVATDSKGTKYSEVAIFDVSGLYRVKIPGQNTSASVNFQEAFMGSFGDGISLDVTSAIVNGNMKFNTSVSVDDYLIVIGDANVNSKTTNIKNFYVKGNLISCTNLNVYNAYVEKKYVANGVNNFLGGLYVEEGLDVTASGKNLSADAQCNTGTGGNLYVKENLTVNKGSVDLPAHTTAYPIEIDGNLVVRNGGKFNFPDASELGGYAQPYTFKVGKNVSVEGGINNGSHITYTVAPNFSLGKSSSDVVYLGPTSLTRVSDGNGMSVYSHWGNNWVNSPSQKKLQAYNFWYQWYTLGDALAKNTFCNSSNCAPTERSGVTQFYKNDNFYDCLKYDTSTYYYGSYAYCSSYNTARNEVFLQVNGTLTSTAPDVSSWLASDMSEYTDRITTEESAGCGTKEHIEDPIQFNKDILKSSYVHTPDNPKHCNGDAVRASWPSDPWKGLNDCYKTAESHDELYGDDDGKWLVFRISDPMWANGSTLDGNFIIIVDDNGSGASLALPSTTASSSVILYFPNGYSKGLKTQGTDSQYNYFIFSEGDIGAKDGGKLQLASYPINGSIFLSDCHSAYSDQTINVDYNANLVSAIESAGIVCGGSSGGCGSSSNSSSSGTSSEANDGKDGYYVATSPQLNVNLVSLYKNDEIGSKTVSNDGVEPSVILLPRIVYMPVNPVGKLSDYYTIVPLNGASDDLLGKELSCPSEIKTSGSLYDGENAIDKGNYTCYYDEGGLNIPLYVSVSGTRGQNPTVTFADEDGQEEITAGGTVNVKLSVPSGDRQVTVQVVAPSKTALPNGWNYTEQSGVTKVSDDGTDAIYSITLTPDGSDVNLFQVTTELSASQADVNFQLTEPCNGCIIGSPFVERVYMNGFVTIARDSSLTSYCAEHSEAFLEKFGESCSDVASRPNCGSLLSSSLRWVTATGQSCTEKALNGEWQCNTGLSVSLQGYETGSEYCDEFVTDSTISLMELNETYEIPAVIKRKPVTLNVNLTKKGSGSVTVEYYRPGATDSGTFTTWSNSPCTSDCTVDLYAGDIVLLTADNGTDKFSYWTCSGDNCNESADTKVATTSYKISLTKTATINAVFNDRDINCIYTNFSNTKAFCSSSSDDDCIDKCASGTHCEVSSGYYKDANWTLVYANKYQLGKLNAFEEPTISNSNSYVTAPQYLGSSLVGATSVILSRIIAGYNGTLTALFEVPTVTSALATNLFKQPISDGFIIRSNADASSYLTVTVVSKIDNGYWTYARVCYVNGQNNSNSDCEDIPFKSSLLDDVGAVVTRLSKASISITSKDDLISMSLSFNFGSSDFGSLYAALDLDTVSFGNKIYNDSLHEYVGIKFGNPSLLQKLFSTQFKVYDFAWKSDSHASSCWDTPTVSCSFKANYSGNTVPENEDVSPWVSTSSWFNNKNCSVKYFYNGCDVPSSYFGSGHSILDYFIDDNVCANNGLGYYQWSAKELNSYKRGQLQGENYKFTMSGLHGYSYNNGTAKEASVLVSCTEDGGSGHVYTAGCGEFNVGEIKQCSESYANLISETVNCSAEGECSIAMNIDSTINVRSSEIRFSIDNLSSGAVGVYLVDKNGLVSNAGQSVTENGTYNFSVNDNVIGDAGFNPQQVTGIKFVGVETTGFSVTKIQSVCSYALTLTCNKSVYDVDAQSWTVSAKVTHPEQAENCKITPKDAAKNSSDIPDPSTCASFNQVVKQKGVYNQTIGQTYIFHVAALDESGEELASCEDTTVVPVISFASCELSPSDENIKQGAGIPSLSFALSNCPSNVCEYTVYYDDVKVETTQGTSESGRCPTEGCDVLNKVSAYTTGSEHTYKVTAYGATCEKSFDIVSNDEAATCVSAGIAADNKTYSATTSRAWSSGTLVITDALNSPVKTVSLTGNGSTSISYDLSQLGASAGTYYVTLTVDGNSCTLQKWTVSSSGSDTQALAISGCSVSETSQDPSSAIQVSVNSVNGCDGNSCTLNVSPATSSGETSNYGSGSFSFYDVNKTGHYTATITRSGYTSGSCTFDVSFKSEETSSDSSYKGTICLNGDWSEVTSGNALPSGGLTSGKYLVKHSCDVSYGISYYYICSSGANIKWGSMSLTCNGSEIHGSSALSSTEKDLVITSGTLSKIGCGATTASCTTGYTAGESGSTNSSSTSSLCNGSCTYTKTSDDIERDGYPDRTMFVLQANETVSLDKQTEKISIGCWDYAVHKIKVQDCSGTSSERTITCNDWVNLDISDKCTIYVQALESSLNMKFGAWN